jgi:hypothetical protein
MKQTAVEYIAKELSKQIDNNLFMEVTFNKLLEQAKEMEKQQIIMAFWNSKHSLCDEDTDLLYLAEQYYNAKFKNK